MLWLHVHADFGMQSARDMAGSETDVNPLEAMYLNRWACHVSNVQNGELVGAYYWQQPPEVLTPTAGRGNISALVYESAGTPCLLRCEADK